VQVQPSDEPQPGEQSIQASASSPGNSSAGDAGVTPSNDKAQEAEYNSAEKKRRGEKSHRLRKLMKRLNPTPLPELLFNTIVGIAVGAIAAVLGAWAAGALSGGGVTTTQQIYYQPWDVTGSVGLSSDVHVYSRVSGYCWELSLATDRPDAYRCIDAGNLILDPCLSNPYEGNLSTQVVCPSPSLQSVTLVTLTNPLPKGPVESNAPRYPWLIVLADGERCMAFTGASLVAGGMRENYLCPGAGLWGNVDRSGPLWTIFSLQQGSSDIIQATIAQAYF
jgi:hypothetical protein